MQRRTLVAGALLTVVMTGCSGAAATVGPASATSGPDAFPTSATPARSSQITQSPEQSLTPLAGSSTATPAPAQHRTSHDAAVTPDGDAIRETYGSWMSDISGLDDNLTNVWVTAISEIATSKMTDAAASAANAVQAAHDHAVGTLVDSHQTLSIHGTTASLSDCLDEKHWYVVEDATGKPDPSVTPDYFVGSASFVKVKGLWFVSAWNSHTQRCTF